MTLEGLCAHCVRIYMTETEIGHDDFNGPEPQPKANRCNRSPLQQMRPRAEQETWHTPPRAPVLTPFLADRSYGGFSHSPLPREGWFPAILTLAGGHEHDGWHLWRGAQSAHITKADSNAATVFVHRITFGLKSKKVHIERVLVPVTPVRFVDPPPRSPQGVQPRPALDCPAPCLLQYRRMHDEQGCR